MGGWKNPGLGQYEGIDPVRVRRLLIEAAWMAHPTAKNDPAWLLAGTMFGVGPLLGMNLCVHAGIDPYVNARTQFPDGVPASLESPEG